MSDYEGPTVVLWHNLMAGFRRREYQWLMETRELLRDHGRGFYEREQAEAEFRAREKRKPYSLSALASEAAR